MKQAEAAYSSGSWMWNLCKAFLINACSGSTRDLRPLERLILSKASVFLGDEVHFKTVFLPCLKLSILIGKILLKEMAAKEEWGFGKFRGLHSEAGKGWIIGGRSVGWGGAEKTEKERG